jgi:hypothetical protein
MDLSERISDSLEAAEKTLRELPDPGKGEQQEQQQRIAWLERQLNHLISELQALLADIEAGCSVTDLGFSGEDEFKDMLDTTNAQIANFKAMAHALKLVQR